MAERDRRSTSRPSASRRPPGERWSSPSSGRSRAERPPGGVDRGVAPVAGKALEVAVVVLYVAMLTTALYGSAVPAYRTAAGAKLADRTLADAAARVSAAVPANVSDGSTLDVAAVRVETRVPLPDRIRGATYEIRAVNDSSLVLDHPREAVGGRVRLALPADVVAVTGAWQSTDRTAVLVTREGNRTRVELVSR